MATDYTAYPTLKRYYKFENASDLGEDEQGTLSLINNNGVTQSADIPSGTYANPTAQKSADFEFSSSQYLSATHDNSTDVDDLTALTLVFGVKFESKIAYSRPVEKEQVNGWSIAMAAGGDNPITRFGGGSWCGETFSINTDTWYFFAVTYSQITDDLRYYRGMEETQVSLISNIANVDKTAATALGFGLGGTALGGNRMDGKLCEIAIFVEQLELTDLQSIQQYGMDGSGEAAATILPQMLQHHGG